MANKTNNNGFSQIKELLDEFGNRLTNIESKLNRIEQSNSTNPINTDKNSQFNGLDKTSIDKIENIMEEFDFKTVHSVMEFLDWTWWGKDVVPSIETLESEAKRLLIGAARERTTMATGGFRAVCESDGENDPDPYIALEFIVTDHEGYSGV